VNEIFLILLLEGSPVDGFVSFRSFFTGSEMIWTFCFIG